jgi:hypothetical protein
MFWARPVPSGMFAENLPYVLDHFVRYNILRFILILSRLCE